MAMAATTTHYGSAERVGALIDDVNAHTMMGHIMICNDFFHSISALHLKACTSLTSSNNFKHA